MSGKGIDAIAFEVTVNPPPPKVRVVEINKGQADEDRRTEIAMLKLLIRRHPEHARKFVLDKSLLFA